MASVFSAVACPVGSPFHLRHPNRSGFEFARVACELPLQYRATETIHLVIDNLNIHRHRPLTEAFADLRSGTASPSVTRPRMGIVGSTGGNPDRNRLSAVPMPEGFRASRAS